MKSLYAILVFVAALLAATDIVLLGALEAQKRQEPFGAFEALGALLPLAVYGVVVGLIAALEASCERPIGARACAVVARYAMSAWRWADAKLIEKDSRGRSRLRRGGFAAKLLWCVHGAATRLYCVAIRAVRKWDGVP